MKKTFSAFLLFSLLQVAFAFAGNKTITLLVPNPNPTDTVPYVLTEEPVSTCADTLSLSPAFDLYSEFDTENIHYTKFHIDSLHGGSRKIALNDPNSCGYVPPFIGKITCPWGPHRRYFHYGVDIDLETGEAVGAAFDGKVRIAKKSTSYGNVVVIRHSNGLETYYAHLSKINVEVGQEVFAGDIIGLGGNTGYSRGSHLHFEVRYLGQPINPADLISFTDCHLLEDTLLINKETFKYYAKATKTTKNGNVANGGKLLAGNVYVIKQGDSLSAIAHRYGVSVAVICKKNGISTSSVLRLGQKLKI